MEREKRSLREVKQTSIRKGKNERLTEREPLKGGLRKLLRDWKN